ncbi:heterokaryon incompatibility protein-domain-containing protein [Daedaleopsis nitida]|nr:heterokaryon incompatibility protein-domain-containing protein [Daedaleopsis nitida]
MWLLHTEKIQLQWFPNPSEVSYATLSHVWGDHEQTFQDTPRTLSHRSRNALRRARDRALRRPSQKIRAACARARRDGFRWLWVDTCCIDKTNSTELSEAINSMYAYYRGAAMCYAYLDDVAHRDNPNALGSSFRNSKWFQRGWTLQELIAPHSVIFLASDWEVIGTKWRLAPLLEDVTGIDRHVLTHKRSLDDVSVACRLSWAAGRKTSRVEDEAYSLMGLFGVYMPTIYGEGKHAFIRLQEEIIKKSPDQTIFAWGRTLVDYDSGRFVEVAQEHDYELQCSSETLLASSPADFTGCADIRPVSNRDFAKRLDVRETVPEYAATSLGIRTSFPMISVAQTSSVDAALALLACEDAQGRLVALYLRSHPKTNTSTKYYVGGFIARGGRRNLYYRATRLPLSAMKEQTARSRPLLDEGRLRTTVQPVHREIHVHSQPGNMARPRAPRTESEPSSTSSMVFFEPPCTLVFSGRCVERLRKMGYIMPRIPENGFRLQSSRESRSVSFVGFESFTVHFGVSPLDGSSATQTAQLWACVRFDQDFDSLLGARSPGTQKKDAPPMQLDPASEVVPDESMFVQSWRNARASFGIRGKKQVRLAFSYPCSVNAEISTADVYELDIRFEGYYQQSGGAVGLKRQPTVTTLSSAPRRQHLGCT